MFLFASEKAEKTEVSALHSYSFPSTPLEKKQVILLLLLLLLRCSYATPPVSYACVGLLLSEEASGGNIWGQIERRNYTFLHQLCEIMQIGISLNGATCSQFDQLASRHMSSCRLAALCALKLLKEFAAIYLDC